MGRYQTWLEIDLDAVANNVQVLKSLCRPSRLMAVVKADGYGLGAVEISRTALENGADFLGVFGVDEAMELREHGIKAPLLNLTEIPQDRINEILENNVTQAVYTAEFAEAMSKVAERMNKEGEVHIKVDTGLGRVGVQFQKAEGFIFSVAKLPGLNISGLFSTLSDGMDREYSELQFERFMRLLSSLKKSGIDFKFNHIVSSAGLQYRHMYLDMVRCGITLYGIRPEEELEIKGLRPVMQFRTSVNYVKDVGKNEKLGYSGTYVTKRRMKVATLSAGYYDGLNRKLSNRGKVLVNGRVAQILGRVSINHCIVDVSKIPNVEEGTEVTLIGSQGRKSTGVEEFASLCETNPYEVLCKLGQRVPRLYFKNGKVCSVRKTVSCYEKT